MVTLFDIEWSKRQEYTMQHGTLIGYTSNEFGEVYLTELFIEDELTSISITEFYKILSILRENYLLNRKTVICIESEKKWLENIKDGKLIKLTIEDILTQYPLSVIEKQKRTLLNISRMQPEIGKYLKDINIYDCFAKDTFETAFILNILETKQYITNGYSITGDGSPFIRNGIRIEENGWIEIEKYESRKKYKQAFIAMWFNHELDEAYRKIEKACNDNGYFSLRIDTKEHNNEISSEILYEIRKSHFLISEVTGQRQGVYFEAGYALAFGLPVIWCCRQDDLKNVHFDTRQYNHIVWENYDELYEKVSKRIKGTIL